MADREAVRRRLTADGIATGIYYPQPLHRTTPCQRPEDGARAFPVADRATDELLAIPLYPEMSEMQVDDVVKGVGCAVALSAVGRTVSPRA